MLPEIILKNATGKAINIRDLDAKYIVIDLWATWCSPCIKDMTKVPDLRKKYKDIEFYNISFDKEKSKMDKFIDKKNTPGL